MSQIYFTTDMYHSWLFEYCPEKHYQQTVVKLKILTGKTMSMSESVSSLFIFKQINFIMSQMTDALIHLDLFSLSFFLFLWENFLVGSIVVYNRAFIDTKFIIIFLRNENLIVFKMLTSCHSRDDICLQMYSYLLKTLIKFSIFVFRTLLSFLG